MSSKYGFIIDTDSSSGNFEREMCAYLTGQIGDCGVGDEHVDAFKEQFPKEYEAFEDIIGSESDEGCYRPCEIETTPGRFNHGMGTCFDDDADMDIVKQDYIKQVDAHYIPLLKQAETRIANGEVEWKRDADGYKKRMQEARDNEITKFGAYESVKIHFNEKPSPELIDFMKQRAEDFAKTQVTSYMGEDYCKIKGFRLEENVTTTTTISI
jgi:hypothetical protein